MFLPVDAAYDRWAAFYDAYENPMVFMATEIVRRLPVAAGASVFEFGCGTGRNLAMLREAGAGSVCGCDLSEGMLAVARERVADARLLVQDMTQPAPVESGSVDLALFCLTLEHVEDLAAPLGEARRILRHGARVAVIEIHPYLSHGGVKAHFQDGAEEIHMPTVPHQFAGYLNAFAATGLRVEACREWRPADFGTAAPLKALKRGPDFPLTVEFWLAAR